jgi:hypothetical protein
MLREDGVPIRRVEQAVFVRRIAKSPEGETWPRRNAFETLRLRSGQGFSTEVTGDILD